MCLIGGRIRRGHPVERVAPRPRFSPGPGNIQKLTDMPTENALTFSPADVGW